VNCVDWRCIDTVLLDMDGTLLDLYFDNHFWQIHLPLRYAEAHGLAQADALHYLQQRFEQAHGTLQWYCLDFWRDELKLDIVALKQEVSHLIALRPHTVIFLDALKQAGKHIWLVTNAHPDSLALKLAHTPLAQQLDRITSAHTLGHPKETPAFWHALQDLHPFDISRTLFVDDTLSVLEAARDYGIAHLLCITQPDSRATQRQVSHFHAIADFDEVLPVHTSQP
jgi:HAD superfamily hydrolase (TIGR01509 family)